MLRCVAIQPYKSQFSWKEIFVPIQSELGGILRIIGQGPMTQVNGSLTLVSQLNPVTESRPGAHGIPVIRHHLINDDFRKYGVLQDKGWGLGTLPQITCRRTFSLKARIRDRIEESHVIQDPTFSIGKH